MNEYLLRIAAYIESELLGTQCNLIKYLRKNSHTENLNQGEEIKNYKLKSYII